MLNQLLGMRHPRQMMLIDEARLTGQHNIASSDEFAVHIDLRYSRPFTENQYVPCCA